jgi:pimeloyl-ACP methyl ester carboxylesterase
MGEVSEGHGTIDGLGASWLEAPVPAGETPVVYLHGVPDWSFQWRDFLARTGGIAPDLPGFGSSDKSKAFDYSIDGYRSWLEAFVNDRGLDRFSLVIHDWGAVGLALAQAMPERVERLVVIDAVPFLPDYRWHLVARQWRKPLIGELAMGFTFKSVGARLANRGNPKPLPRSYWEQVWEHFDHGTQRAILKLYRSAPPDVLARAGANLGAIDCPSMVVWGASDPYLPTSFAHAYANALGGESEVRIVDGAGHWVWLDQPALVEEITTFVA